MPQYEPALFRAAECLFAEGAQNHCVIGGSQIQWSTTRFRTYHALYVLDGPPIYISVVVEEGS